MLMQVVAAALLVLLIPRAVKPRMTGDVVEDLTPRGAGNFFETICNYLRNEVARPTLGEHTDRFIPYIWTAFFFVLFCNLLGLIPIDAFLQLVGIQGHYGGTATGNVYVTGTLAVCTMALMVGGGLIFGGKAYLAHFCPGPLWLAPLLVPVEILGLIAKIFALAMRLFANMIAGHILLAVLIGFVGVMGSLAGRVAIGIPVVLGSVAITLLEIFVAFLQAFIFTFLTSLFIGQSVVLHHGEEHGAGEHGH
jgi:F-type H+-transporting ATPase subunit a